MTQNIARVQIRIDDWVTSLAAIPENLFTLETVQDFVVQHPVQPGSLEPYLFFSKGSYTRNLIFKNALFECMTLCWEVGQHSRIHNHRDQNCWMSAPIGRLHIRNYRVENMNPITGDCQIIPTDIYQLDASQPTFVNPMEPVHEVMNLADSTSAPSASTSIPNPSTPARSITATKINAPTCRFSIPANMAS
jgi:cysteine dioxygenase